MSNIGYAFIGTPKGLQTKNGGILDGADIRRYIDLDGNVIKVDPNTELFSIRKVLMDEEVLYFITQYEYAKEIESHRTGTFFGATLVLKNASAPAETILLVLSELMASLREYIAPDGRFMTTLERIPLKESRRLRSLSSNLRPTKVSLEQLSGQSLFVQMKGNNDFRERVNFIHQCLNNKNFAPFSTIYASDDTSIFNFVRANKTMRTASIGVSYETQFEKLEKHYQDLLQNVERENASFKELGAKREELKQSIAQLTAKQNKLTSRYKDTEMSIVANLGKLQKLEKSLTASVRNLEVQQESASQAFAKSKRDHDMGIAGFEANISKLQSNNEALQSEHSSLETGIKQMQANKLKLQRNNQKLMDDFELISQHLKKAHLQNDELLAANEDLIQQKTTLEDKVQALQSEQERLAALVVEAEMALQTKTEEIETIEEEIFEEEAIEFPSFEEFVEAEEEDFEVEEEELLEADA